jgi:hypothetical protein
MAGTAQGKAGAIRFHGFAAALHPGVKALGTVLNSTIAEGTRRPLFCYPGQQMAGFISRRVSACGPDGLLGYSRTQRG